MPGPAGKEGPSGKQGNIGPQGRPGPKGEAGPKGRWIGCGYPGREKGGMTVAVHEWPEAHLG
jgi:hypothetical protein